MDGPPVVAPRTSAAFPGVSVDLGEVVAETATGEDGDICTEIRHGAEGATGLVEVDLVRSGWRELWPVFGRIGLRRRGRRIAIGESRRDGRIVVGDKVAVNVHECLDKVRTLHVGGRAKVADHVVTVQSGYDTVLVAVCGSTGSTVRFGHPVAGADKGELAIDVLCARRSEASSREVWSMHELHLDGMMGCTYVCACLLTVGDGGDAGCVWRVEAIGGVVGGNVGVEWILLQDLCDVLILQEREEGLEPLCEVLFGVDGARNEQGALCAVVTDEEVFAIDASGIELLRRYILHVGAVGDGQEGPRAEETACRDLDVGLLECLGVLGEKTLEDVLVGVAVGRSVEAACLGGKGVVRL